MAINEVDRQTEVAAELSETARTLAHSTRSVPNGADSYRLIGELSDTIQSLRYVAYQLGEWHAGAVDGTHFDGDDGSGDGRACEHTQTHLRNVADLLCKAGEQVDQAHTENGRIRWIGN
ncbi:hypothetical protein G6016_00585 [Dietzia aerolata]|uniref:WXG100 family type VII secretion target n=1 Tax=Dietzia aerolata TaxID=595984 RepID=A0ABV5JTF9_9ACTN|nr:hypothetical protein [Dietzia aerolata]MBB0967479.1 hypothetical protein [Dietzia aerolata]